MKYKFRTDLSEREIAERLKTVGNFTMRHTSGGNILLHTLLGKEGFNAMYNIDMRTGIIKLSITTYQTPHQMHYSEDLELDLLLGLYEAGLIINTDSLIKQTEIDNSVTSNSVDMLQKLDLAISLEKDIPVDFDILREVLETLIDDVYRKER